MKRILLVILAIALFMPSQINASDLSKGYNLSIGEVLELHCGVWDGLTSFTTEGLLGSTEKVIAYYKKDANILHLVFYGEKQSLDNAKAVLALVNTQVVPKIIEYASTKFKIDLNASDFMLIYTHKDSGKEILFMEDGKYVFPE